MQARSNILPKLKACQIKIKFDIIILKIIKDIEHMTDTFHEKEDNTKNRGNKQEIVAYKE